mmetsp:Transcript_76748/g.133041  ORF Transcript_76748/g.133041 Transcript_76748/m.133041 type:complete len:102 (+) Transcript_76748:753-1058(+)
MERNARPVQTWATVSAAKLLLPARAQRRATYVQQERRWHPAKTFSKSTLAAGISVGVGALISKAQSSSVPALVELAPFKKAGLPRIQVLDGCLGSVSGVVC